jgi:hypothetical protein
MGRKLSWQTASHKVNNPQAVTFGKLGCDPLITRNDVAVQFYGDPILLHPQLLDQRGK